MALILLLFPIGMKQESRMITSWARPGIKKERYLKLINRMVEIKKKGFNMIGTEDDQIPGEATGYVPVDFAKIRVGVKSLSDAVLRLGDLRRINPSLADKEQVLRAIHYGDLNKMRDISNYFYKVSGIYQRLCIDMIG